MLSAHRAIRELSSVRVVVGISWLGYLGVHPCAFPLLLFPEGGFPLGGDLSGVVVHFVLELSDELFLGRHFCEEGFELLDGLGPVEV